MYKTVDYKCKIACLYLHTRVPNCCNNCVQRLIYGAELIKNNVNNVEIMKNVTNFDINLKICPFCCGLLQLRSMCTLANKSTSDKFVLDYILQEVYASKWCYTAYNFEVTEPVNIVIREHFLWSHLLSLSHSDLQIIQDVTKDDLLESIKSENNTNVFSNEDIKYWKNTSVSAKIMWKWIVELTLNSLLNVPLINGDSNVVAMRMNDLSNTAIPDESSNLMSVSIEFADANTHVDHECLMNYLKCSHLPVAQIYYNRLSTVRHNCKRRLKFKRLSTTTTTTSTNEIDLDKTDELGQTCSDKVVNDDQGFQIINLNYIPVKSISRNVINELQNSLPDDLFHNALFDCTNKIANCPAFLTSIKLKRIVPLVVAGRYVKLSRKLPQTPWIVGSKRALASSVEELITNPIKAEFGENCQTTFVSSGREDVDVRCLGLGRPFVIQLDNYANSSLAILSKWSSNGMQSFNNQNKQLEQHESMNLMKLAHHVNLSSQNMVFIRDLQFVSAACATASLKSGEMEKSKSYRALCWCPQGGLNANLLSNMIPYTASHPIDLSWPPPVLSDDQAFGHYSFGPIELNQLTPIRVLHRRTLMNRVRTVQSISFSSYAEVMRCELPEYSDFKPWTKIYPVEELFFVTLRCDAGTYIKEFVHGDLGRCRPSLASILRRQIDILALDVTAVQFDWPKNLDY